MESLKHRTVTRFGLSRLARLAAALPMAAAAALPLQAAEVTGSVSVRYQGLFESGNTPEAHPVSVALLPGQKQRTRAREARTYRIEVINNRMHPAFLTVQRGDRVAFVNHDAVFHELFSLSPDDPVRVRLGKSERGDHYRAGVTLSEAGTVHIFCRIHNKGYARIDVVDTPYLQMVQPGEAFRFDGLTPGRWRLRLAAPAAETKWVDVTAMTTPPPLQLDLTSRGGSASPSAGHRTESEVGKLYRRPDGTVEAKR